MEKKIQQQKPKINKAEVKKLVADKQKAIDEKRKINK